MSTLSYYQPRTQRKKQQAPRSQDGHRSLTVTFDPKDVAKNLCDWINSRRGGSVNTKNLQDWYFEQEYKEALKEWMRTQMGGITEFAKRAHCLTVTNASARDVFIQTPQHAESVEAKVQANPFNEKIEELQSKITTQQSQIVHLEESLRELTSTVRSSEHD